MRTLLAEVVENPLSRSAPTEPNAHAAIARHGENSVAVAGLANGRIWVAMGRAAEIVIGIAVG